MSDANCNFDSEEWRDIPGFPGYQVSSIGNVRSRRQSGMRKLLPDGHWHAKAKKTMPYGYLVVYLANEGTWKQKKIHRLVLEAFVGPCPPLHECCHRDDNRGNNVLDNLYWGTKQDNSADRIRNAKRTRIPKAKRERRIRNYKLSGLPGEKNPAATITDNDVIAIRGMAMEGKRYDVIAKEFGISKSIVSYAARGKTFAHLPGAVPPRRNMRKNNTPLVAVVPSGDLAGTLGSRKDI